MIWNRQVVFSILGAILWTVAVVVLYFGISHWSMPFVLVFSYICLSETGLRENHNNNKAVGTLLSIAWIMLGIGLGLLFYQVGGSEELIEKVFSNLLIVVSTSLIAFITAYIRFIQQKRILAGTQT